jgi:hypothetical protein
MALMKNHPLLILFIALPLVRGFLKLVRIRVILRLKKPVLTGLLDLRLCKDTVFRCRSFPCRAFGVFCKILYKVG